MLFIYVFLFLNSQQAAVLLYNKEPDPIFEKRISKNTLELIFLSTHMSNAVPSKTKGSGMQNSASRLGLGQLIF